MRQSWWRRELEKRERSFEQERQAWAAERSRLVVALCRLAGTSLPPDLYVPVDAEPETEEEQLFDFVNPDLS